MYPPKLYQGSTMNSGPSRPKANDDDDDDGDDDDNDEGGLLQSQWK